MDSLCNCKKGSGTPPKQKKLKVVFVLGGPGSGKGTQCEKIVQHFGYTHFSVGDLLREEVRTGSENGTLIQHLMNEGKLVPSDLTVRLMKQAIEKSNSDKFLIDGFPRNEENIVAFENIKHTVAWAVPLHPNMKFEPDFLLFLDCPLEEMERRILSRNQGREDDNVETIRKRFQTFQESTLPVIEYYNKKGKVRKVDGARPPEEVFNSVKAIFCQTKKRSSFFDHCFRCWRKSGNS